jgi:hypothetical protein
MALYPVKFFWPIRLDPGASSAFTVEDEVKGAKFVLDPLLRFYNTSSGLVHLKIEHTLDLGFGDDPLYSGTWTFNLVDEDIASMSIRDFQFTPQIDNDTEVATRHTITITNPDLLQECIVRLILFGSTEISTRLPANQEIVK